MRDTDAGVDKAIDKVLAGLREAEPSRGIERRILAAIEAREQPAGNRLWGKLLRPAIALSLLCAVFLAGHFLWRVSTPVMIVATEAPGPQRIPEKTPTVAPRIMSRQRHVWTAQLASYPAPPLPLTEQEKLLLRLAHGRDVKDLAILNPEVRAEQSAKTTQQFQQFFQMNDVEMRRQLE